MNKGIIYIANVPNGMAYVGQTIQPLLKRKHGEYNPYFTNAIKKYSNKIVWKILIEVSEKELDTLEVFFIAKYNTLYPNGYNFETGGNKNKHASLKTRIKMSDNHADVSGKNNPNYGKHRSEDIKNRISKSKEKFEYTITRPDGVIEITKNLKKYCKENGLHNTAMSLVFSGKQKYHKGFKCKRLDQRNTNSVPERLSRDETKT